MQILTWHEIVDVGTGSSWDLFGRAVDGPLGGAQLETVISGSHFWFAWSVFQPETRVIFGTDAGDSQARLALRSHIGGGGSRTIAAEAPMGRQSREAAQR